MLQFNELPRSHCDTAPPQLTLLQLVEIKPDVFCRQNTQGSPDRLSALRTFLSLKIIYEAPNFSCLRLHKYEVKLVPPDDNVVL